MTRHLRLAVAIVGLSLGATPALAGDLSKEACVDAHSRGQDAKEQGKLSLARKLFLTCAQSSCPAAVQGDCARFADDLSTMQPTIVFVARDAGGNDLPNTTVYVDGVLLVTTLDGKPQDIDPGNHTVRFSNRGRDEMLTVVIGTGEKGRTVAARFDGGADRAVDAPAATSSREPSPAQPRRSTARTTHPGGAMAIAITGSVIAVGGAALAFYGVSKVPAACSLSTNECSAPPGDPVFAQATSGARTMNYGIMIGATGTAALAGGLIWYFAGAKTTRRESATQVSPVVTNDGGGFAVSGRF